MSPPSGAAQPGQPARAPHRLRHDASMPRRAAETVGFSTHRDSQSRLEGHLRPGSAWRVIEPSRQRHPRGHAAQGTQRTRGRRYVSRVMCDRTQNRPVYIAQRRAEGTPPWPPALCNARSYASHVHVHVRTAVVHAHAHYSCTVGGLLPTRRTAAEIRRFGGQNVTIHSCIPCIHCHATPVDPTRADASKDVRNV